MSVITTTLRGRELTGTVTSADLIPISHLLMTTEERGVMMDRDQPDPIRASQMMQDRLTKQLSVLTKKYGGDDAAADRANEDIVTGWIKRLMVVCEADLEVRTLVLTRLIEVFPELPPEWVSYNPITRLASHRLEMDEILIKLVLPVYAAIAQMDEAEIKARTTEAVRVDTLFAKKDATPPAAAPESPPTPAAIADSGVDVSTLTQQQRLQLLTELQAEAAQPDTVELARTTVLSELASKPAK